MKILSKLRTGGAYDTGFGKVYSKTLQINKIQGSSEAVVHSFSEEEKAAFVEHMNNSLKVSQYECVRAPP